MVSRAARGTASQVSHERDLQAAIEYARQVHASDMQHRQFVKDYGSQVLRALFLLNGAAILATFALIGSLAARDAKMLAHPALFVPAFSAYVVGILAALAAMALGYFNFQYNSISEAGPKALAERIVGATAHWPSAGSATTSKHITGTAKAAVAAVGISVIAFVVGSIAMACVFRHLPLF